MTYFQPVYLTIPASLQHLNVVSAALGAILSHAALPQTGKQNPVYQMQLAVHEICTNIIEHAYHMDSSRRITLMMWLETAPIQLHVHICDDSGLRFDASAVVPPALGEMQERGLGLFLVHQLMDDVQYAHHDGKNIWKLSKTWQELKG